MPAHIRARTLLKSSHDQIAAAVSQHQVGLASLFFARIAASEASARAESYSAEAPLRVFLQEVVSSPDELPSKMPMR